MCVCAGASVFEKTSRRKKEIRKKIKLMEDLQEMVGWRRQDSHNKGKERQHKAYIEIHNTHACVYSTKFDLMCHCIIVS